MERVKILDSAMLAAFQITPGDATLFTPAVDALVRVSGSIACEVSDAAGSIVLTLNYTDISGQAQQLNSATAVCTTLGVASVVNFSSIIQAKGGTLIDYTTSTANTVQYSVRIAAEQLVP